MSYCNQCGYELDESARFCSTCGAEILDYPHPGGFWIRVGATLIDSMVFLPLAGAAFFNLVVLKSIVIHILISVPRFLYKPLMEHFFGATLGKMVCRLRVEDQWGRNLTMPAAYVRYLPFLFLDALSIIAAVILFSRADFKAAASLEELRQLQGTDTMGSMQTIVSFFCIFECMVVAFTYRKRALHDMMAGSFCVYDYAGKTEQAEQDWD